MNLAVPTNDGRQIEILAQGLPLHHGANSSGEVFRMV